MPAACLLVLLLGCAGCSLLRLPGRQQRVEVTSLQPANPPRQVVTPALLHVRVMRFADEYVATVAQGTDDLAGNSKQPEVRLAALQWKLGQATSAFINATGPNPALDAMDMLVLVTVSRMVVEDSGSEMFHAEPERLLEMHRRLETNAWLLVSGVLRPNQQEELRGLIREWREKNPRQRYVGNIRFREFVAALGRTPSPMATPPTSVFSLLFIDPFAGLDPAATALDETRRLGERAMYYAQRLPTLLSWQAELLAYQMAVQPEIQTVLRNVDSLARSAQVFSDNADRLPDIIDEQREAAIGQILEGLKGREDKAGVLLVEARHTLDAGANAASAISNAVVALDMFVTKVRRTNSSRAVSTNRHRFDVREYGAAAAEIGAAAEELNTLFAAMDQSSTRLADLGRQTRAEADQVVNRAFWLGAMLIVIFLAGAVLAALLYRRITHRRSSGVLN